MRNQVLNFVKFFVFLGIGAGVLYWVVRQSNLDWESIKAGFARANYTWIFISILFGAASNVFRAIRWKMLLSTLGKKPSLINTMFAVLNGYFFNLMLPRLGEVTRCGILSRYEKIPLVQVAGTAVWDRVVDLFFLAIVMGIMLLTQFGIVWEYTYNNILGDKILKLKVLLSSPAGIIGGIVLLILVFFVFTRFLQPRIASSTLYARFKSIVSDFADGVKTIRNLNSLPWFIMHSILLWVCYFGMMYSSMFAFPEVGKAGVGGAITMLVFGTFGMMAPVQGGMGAFHLAVQAALILYGVKPDVALLFAFVVHASQQGLVLVLGFISFILLPIYNKGRITQPEQA